MISDGSETLFQPGRQAHRRVPDRVITWRCHSHSACAPCSCRAVALSSVRNMCGLVSKLPAAQLLHPAPLVEERIKVFAVPFAFRLRSMLMPRCRAIVCSQYVRPCEQAPGRPAAPSGTARRGANKSFRGAIRIPLALHAHAALSRYRLFAICAAL